MRLARDLFGKPLHETGLANARFAAEHYDLAHTFLHLLPTLSEYRHFCFPSDKGSQPALLHNNVEAGACLTFPEDVIGHEALVTP
jgi:hypothetical protein